MTSPILKLFKEQLENEAKGIASEKDIDARGDHLIWWYFLRLEMLEETLVGEIVCDGGGDLGIDAIWIDENNIANFYTFKNPLDETKSFPAGEIDKTLSGLRLILERNHKGIANADLRSRVEEIYQTVPSGYFLHVVTSGNGIPDESTAKLESFVGSLGGPSEDFFRWKIEDLKFLQDRFYRRHLPTVEEPISFTIDLPPYQLRSANHDSYLFHVSGSVLADLYKQHGEQLLQQNIRIYQGDSSTNALISQTASGEEAENFIHYNNGVTFLCETASWDGFTKLLTLKKAQVVNGGQTIRVITQARDGRLLKPQVGVPVRVITSQGDKEFASNVAVNLNNQNKIDPSFLRSNEPRIIQLANALESIGWYLERRDGELKSLTDQDKEKIESKIGNSVEDRTIRLKEGTQAYVATFLRQPELAKKNPKRMFVGVSDGGYFDRIFGSELTAERFSNANLVSRQVAEYVKKFMSLKRRANRVDDWRSEYTDFLGQEIMSLHSEIVNQVIPQSAVFLTALAYEREVRLRSKLINSLIEGMNQDQSVLNELVETIIEVAKNDDDLSKSWPTLLKSQSFFEKVASYIKGQMSATQQ
ncbi:MAG: AIPR family protein [Pseudomonadota bacterium]